MRALGFVEAVVVSVAVSVAAVGEEVAVVVGGVGAEEEEKGFQMTLGHPGDFRQVV